MNGNVKAILFGAEWCNSCHALKPKFYDEVKKLDIRYDVIDVETDEGVELSTKYQVRNVPTILIFKNKELVGRETGSAAYQKIKNYL